MKRAGCHIVTLITLLLLAGVVEASAALKTLRLQNRPYVRLNDWSRLRGFKTSRNPSSREVHLTNASTHITLLIDGSRMEFNDVAVWLSFPVLLSEGDVCVSEQDLRGVLDSLVHPRPHRSGRPVRTVCLDAGHGGKEPGQKLGSRLEKNYTLSLALELRSRLVQNGFNVILTRRNDSYVDHAERTSIAKRANADLFVSLHYNAAPTAGSDANGIEVYAMTPEGARSTNVSADVGSLRAWAGNESDAHNVLLAYELQRSLLQKLSGSEDRGVRRARFLVLRLAEMPAVLIEGGFMSNASDARWIYSTTGRRRMAQAIVEGILAYKRQVDPPPRSSSSTQRSTNSKSSSKTARPASAKN